MHLIFALYLRLIVLIVFLTGILIRMPIANAQTHLWGMTSVGGQYDAGTIFTTDSSGNNQIVRNNLFQYEGAKPLFTNVIQASDGMLYGMTYKGGVNDLGILFQYNPSTNTFIKKIDFDGLVKGSKPFGSLIQASDGMLYGMTALGGINNMGVLFQYNTMTDTYTKKFDFDGATRGRNPHRSLIQATDGNLYGLTAQGGIYDKGVLFQFNPTTSSYNKKFDFDSLYTGSNPLGSVIQASDGMLYGCTVQGGANNMGVLFQYDLNSNLFANKLDFDGVTNGANPIGNLMEASDGNIYGMTNSGGINNLGVLLQYNPSSNIFIKKLDFDGTTYGSKPFGSLMQASNGYLYGMTTLGGVNDVGVLFQYNISTSVYNKKHDFIGTIDGRNPYSTLIQASDGTLYGLTNLGGIEDIGVLFQYNPSSDIYSKKIDFGAADGKIPCGSLMQATNGMLYGMTNSGGKNNLGVLFQYDPATYTYTKKIVLDTLIYGRNPHGSLIEASDGMLYGMTYGGGINDSGIIFQYNPSTFSLIKKFDFTGTASGANPYGSLLQANDGTLYGMTNAGGGNDSGVIFQYNPTTNIYNKLFDLGFTSGANPFGSLIQANDGNLYGMTNVGGINNLGTLFQYNISNNVFSKKFDFDGTVNGSNPEGSLVQANDGMLYGMTYNGGVNNLGVLFQYNPITNTYLKKLDFDGTNNGRNPHGSLIKSSDGMLYGMTYGGGIHDLGILFQYNTSNGNFVNKLNFAGATNGAKPYSNLIEITTNPNGIKQLSVNNPSSIIIYPNPASNSIAISNISQKTTLQIYDIIGKLILEKEIYENVIFETNHLIQGIYMFVFENNKNKTYRKVIITK